MCSHSRGLTMVELLTVLVVVAVLAALAAPSFNEQLARRRLEGVGTDLSTDLQYVRSQVTAEPTGSTVTLVTENAGSQYRIFKTVSGASTDLKTVALPSGVTVTNGITVTYDQLRAAASAAQQIDLASQRTSAAMRVSVSATGRVSLCSPSGSLKGYTSC